MITDLENLREKILFEPARDLGCNELRILSGFASPAMVDYHINELKSMGYPVKIDLTLGMVPSNNIPELYHRSYLDLMNKSDFVCRYLMNGRKPCHSKIYLWLKDGVPIIAYLGSANYSQNAFTGRQREAMEECDVFYAEEYIDQISGDSILCNHDEVEEAVCIVSDKRYGFPIETERGCNIRKSGTEIIDEFTVKLSLLTRNGEIHEKSGLNWGQRSGRDKDQAYIPVSSNIAKIKFFPPSGTYFFVTTDDGHHMNCVIAQDGDKAIETPFNNSELGLYFRNRLGIGSGSFVTKEDLERYGRTDVTFIKIDDENYLMDFSVDD